MTCGMYISQIFTSCDPQFYIKKVAIGHFFLTIGHTSSHSFAIWLFGLYVCSDKNDHLNRMILAGRCCQW